MTKARRSAAALPGLEQSALANAAIPASETLASGAPPLVQAPLVNVPEPFVEAAPQDTEFAVGSPAAAPAVWLGARGSRGGFGMGIGGGTAGSGAIPPGGVTPPGAAPGVDMPDIAAVPEPDTWAMMLLGMAACGAAMRRRRRQEAAAA